MTKTFTLEKLELENRIMKEALVRIYNHGIPKPDAPVSTFISCIMNMSSIAERCLKELGIDLEEVTDA